jgi:hypothetical protein
VSDCCPPHASKSAGVRSRQFGAVCDLELRPAPILCGRSRTAANETRTETGAVPSLMVSKRMRDPPFVAASTWAFSMSTLCVAQDHPADIPRRPIACTTSMRTIGAYQVRASSAAKGRCLRSRVRAVVRPCCCISCCTDLTLTRQGDSVTPAIGIPHRPGIAHDVPVIRARNPRS